MNCRITMNRRATPLLAPRVFMPTLPFGMLLGVFFLSGFLSIALSGCTRNNDSPAAAQQTSGKPVVSNNGITITFSAEQPIFTTMTVRRSELKGEFTSPTSVAACVLAPERKEFGVIILFEDKELNELYKSYLQSVAHVKKDSEYLERVRDMYANKAATGIELRAAETGLAEALSELTEKEASFRLAGFKPTELTRAKANTAWLIANVSESNVGNVRIGAQADVEFTSYPGERFKARVVAIGDVIDVATRTLKVRLELPNTSNRFKPGMYAKTTFLADALNALFVPTGAVVNVQGRNYVFVKQGLSFERREIAIEQQIGDNIVVSSGLREGELVVKESAMLLKGLSFGY